MSENKLSNAYNKLLKKVQQAKKDGERIGNQYWENTQKVLVKAEHLNAEESEIVVEALQRDMSEARHVLKDIGKAISDWLKYDAALVEENLEDWLELVADDTLVDWIHLRQQWEVINHYKSGDLIGLGELTCAKCGYLLQFTQASHVPDCPHCGGTEFEREPQH